MGGTPASASAVMEPPAHHRCAKVEGRALRRTAFALAGSCPVAAMQGMECTAGQPALLAFFDWDSKLPNFQKKMAANAAWEVSKYGMLKVGTALRSCPPH